MEAAALARVRERKKVESYVRLEIELKPLILETKAFQLPFNPPRYSRNKKGELKEDKRTIRYLDVTAGNLRFRVMRNTDPAKVCLRAREVARRCGKDAADQFRKAAAEIVPPLEREKSRPAPDWHTPATGVCNRFRKGACQTELGSPIFEYRNAEQAAADYDRCATLEDGFSAAAAVMASLTPRRRKSRKATTQK